MILAALALAATLEASSRYEALLTKYDVPLFQSGAARYEFYGEGQLEDGRKIVVYGFTPVRRGPEHDFEHRIFVTMITRRGDRWELQSARRDVTAAVFNNGQEGKFAGFRAGVAPFRLRNAVFVDVTLWSSTSDGVSAANDVIFLVTGDGQLVLATTLQESEALRRRGEIEVAEVRSRLSFGDGALRWSRSERVAWRKKPGEPFRVNCQTTQTMYRMLGRGLSPSEVHPKGTLTIMPRLSSAEVVPCCNGCRWKG